MALKSLNQLQWLRHLFIAILRGWNRGRGVRIDDSVRLSLAAKLRQRKRGMIAIDPDTLIAFDALILTYDPATGKDEPVCIGRNCFIGGSSIIMPGVRIGDNSIVAAGAVVMADVPSRSIVAGNPARVIRADIRVGKFGRLEGADEMTRKLYGKVVGTAP